MSKESIAKISKNYKRSVGKITCINNEIDPAQPFTLSNEGNEEVMALVLVSVLLAYTSHEKTVIRGT